MLMVPRSSRQQEDCRQPILWDSSGVACRVSLPGQHLVMLTAVEHWSQEEAQAD